MQKIKKAVKWYIHQLYSTNALTPTGMIPMR